MYRNRFKDNDEYRLKIDSYRPLSAQVLAQIKNYFKISFTYSTNALEGNTLSLSETKIIIEDGLTIGGKPLKEHYEVVGGAGAYELLFELTQNKAITEESILRLHKELYTPVNNEVAGKYRDCNVLITGSEFELPRFEAVPQLMKDFIAEIEGKREELHPVALAAWLHERLVSIHPFVDGNGRTARLLMNLALMQAGFNIVTIPPVVRNDYIVALQTAQLDGDLELFTNFISEMVLEAQKEYLRIIERLV